MMKVNEIFLSIQGESLSAGFPTIFVRFTGCNLRCSYCDTKYAYDEGCDMTVDEVVAAIVAKDTIQCRRVCLTGGEPLLQGDLQLLLDKLTEYIVTIETNGSVDIGTLSMQQGQSFVMDIKSPYSGHTGDMCMDNLLKIRACDEIKFVIKDYDDFLHARDIIKSNTIRGIVTISPVFGGSPYSDMVQWILDAGLNVRFQLQLHKIIWNPEKRGV